jgi:hypothetical protein
MPTTTWELHYGAPRYPADKQFVLGYLAALKSAYTNLAIDWLEDETGIHVMVGDVRTFKDVIRGLGTFGPQRITVITDGEENGITVRTKAVLDEAGDGDNESRLDVAKSRS